MKHPTIEGVPGLVWRELKRDRWSIKWQAQRDIIKQGFEPGHVRLWTGTLAQLDAMSLEWIGTRATEFQSRMLAFRLEADGKAHDVIFDHTVSGLVRCYLTDIASPYHEKRYFTRKHYRNLCARLDKEHGADKLKDIKARDLKHWHHSIASQGKVSMAHGVIGMFRTMVGFGVTMLEDDECERLSVVLSKLRFTAGKPRTVCLNADQVVAIRGLARQEGFRSIALMQAIQFDFTWRQKDVLGEWIPISEPGISDITSGNLKSMCGVRWEQIDNSGILIHETSKRRKVATINVTLASMVVEELLIDYPGSFTWNDLNSRWVIHRDKLPANGPIVIAEKTGLPWDADAFRHIWRKLADKCSIPKNVRNMDSRSGAITEALKLGARPDAVRKTATHSQLAQTMNYSRGDADDIEEVMTIRSGRNKTGKSVA